MLKNQKLASIFYEIADYLTMEEVFFRSQAYRKVAEVLETLTVEVEKIYQKGGLESLEEIPGVGHNIAQKIEEYIKTGKVGYLQDLKRKYPLDLARITSIPGIGPRKAKVLYQKLNIRTLQDLEKAAQENRLAGLFGFAEKSEKNILEGITFLKKDQGRFLLGEILPQAEEILRELKKIKEVEEISLAGSLRRRKESIGDVDILITIKEKTSAEKIMDFFVQLPGVTKVWLKGPTKSSIKMAEGFNVDLRVIRKKSYGSALQYFTGSKTHNILLRRIALEKKMKLSEYGLFKDKKMIAGWDEASLYQALGLSWIAPELREGQGEIEASLEGRLPQLISEENLKGDLHCHSSWDGGVNSILEMAIEGKRIGYQYLGISDHTKFLKIENGLDEKQLAQQGKEIEKLNQKIEGITILQGCEANIMKDGSLDIEDEALKKLDYVIAGVHSHFNLSKEEMTERMIKVMKNPHVNIISHPTGRLLKRREEYQFDFDKILRVAKEYQVALEVNASYYRLDLNEKNIRRAKEAGVKMVINTDAHEKSQLNSIGLGVSQARRGWAEEKDIINSWSLEKLLKFLQK